MARVFKTAYHTRAIATTLGMRSSFMIFAKNDAESDYAKKCRRKEEFCKKKQKINALHSWCIFDSFPIRQGIPGCKNGIN